MSQDDSAYERGAAYERFHSAYRPYPHTGSCFYCGGDDSSEDHVPPLATLHKLRGFAPKRELLLVRCCGNCNSALGDMPLMTPEERRDYIRKVFLPQRLENLKLAIEDMEAKVAANRAELSRLQKLLSQSLQSIGEAPPGAVPFAQLECLRWFRRSPDSPRLYQKADDHHCVIGGARLRMRPVDWVYPAS